MLTKNIIEKNENVILLPLKKTVPKFKFKAPQNDGEKAVQAFLQGKTGTFGRYVATKNALVYRAYISQRESESSWSRRVDASRKEVAQDIIALRIDKPTEVLFIGNSSVLPLLGRKVAFGHEVLNRTETEIQRYISSFIPMVPFSVFKEAKLNLFKMTILERGKPSQVTRRVQTGWDYKTDKPKMREETVHFTGASLFKVEDKTFLFDIDQREIKHKIFNPFLVQLVHDVATIKEAYQSLKPIQVIEAEKNGLKVLRQGEWFFIPVDGQFEAEKERNSWSNKLEYKRFTLQAGPNRPNHVNRGLTLPNGDVLVTGTVKHSGREHAALLLKQWYKAVPNTSTRSFTITGDVD